MCGGNGGEMNDGAASFLHVRNVALQFVMEASVCWEIMLAEN